MKIRPLISHYWILSAFLLVTLAYASWSALVDQPIHTVVQSDARGYYAFLPAFFTHQDPTFTRSVAVEKSYHPESYDPYYLFKTSDGRIYNKYFPGVAVLQAPFYLLAAFLALLFGLPNDGYSAVFMVGYFTGTMVYAAAAIVLFFRLYRKLFPGVGSGYSQVLFILLLLCGPVVYYAFMTQSYSQVHSLFALALTAHAFVNCHENKRRKDFLLLAFALGLVFLIRPTNLVCVVFLPALLPHRNAFKELVRSILGRPQRLLLPGLVVFLITVSILLFVWKWQTGHWISWSYNGEGFNFLHPVLWTGLFSFRSGLFLQIPAMLVVIAGAVILAKQSLYRFIWWLAYGLLNTWIITSWWCWDFESQFSIRPLTEHFFFLVFPLFFLLRQRRSFLLPAIGLCAAIGLLRLVNFQLGYMTDQRFTSSNYFSSLAFWNKENHGRWSFTQSCEPYGKVKHRFVLTNSPATEHFNGNKEFGLTGTAALPPRTTERLYYRVTLEKKLYSADMDGVYLVIDATGKNNKRYYSAIGLYNDRFEGKNDWKTLTFEGLIPDNFQELDGLSIYTWNSSKREFDIRNFKSNLTVYSTD